MVTPIKILSPPASLEIIGNIMVAPTDIRTEIHLHSIAHESAVFRLLTWHNVFFRIQICYVLRPPLSDHLCNRNCFFHINVFTTSENLNRSSLSPLSSEKSLYILGPKAGLWQKRIQELVLGSNLDRNIHNLEKGFFASPESLLAYGGMLPSSRPYHFLPESFQFYIHLSSHHLTVYIVAWSQNAGIL